MPRPAAKLTNCYVPLPLAAAQVIKNDDSSVKRKDRESFEQRQLCLETNVLPKSSGSSLVELGHTKVLCSVMLTSSDEVEIGTLECKVKLVPHVGFSDVTQQSHAAVPLDSTISAGKMRAETMSMETNLSNSLQSALEPAVRLEQFPKGTLEVVVTVLQGDGSVLSACVAASTLALVDAQVEMNDLVTCCTVAVVARNSSNNTGLAAVDNDNELEFLADPTEAESYRATTLVTLAMMMSHKELTFLSQEGRLTASSANRALELCRDGCRTMHKFIREYWIAQIPKME